MAMAEPVSENTPYRCASAQTTLPCHDPARLAALLQSLEPRLIRVALRFTRDPETARDVVQNAFEKVLRYCHHFRGDAKASTWLHRIVTNEALMWLRSEGRCSRRAVIVDHLEKNEVPDPTPGAAEQLERRERCERVRAGVARLRPPERDVLLRCELAEQSYAQFGAETGMHPAALKTRAFRARQHLRPLLENA